VSAPAASSWPAAGLVLWALWLAVYLAAPARWHTVAIAGRFAPAVALATLWLVPLRAPGSPAGASSLRAARLALVGVAATALLLAHDVFARYDRSLAPLARVIDAIPRGSRVTTLAYQPFPDGIRLPMYAHVGGYVHAARGGLAASSFTGTGVTYRDEVPRRLRLGDDVLAPWRSGWVLDDAMAAYWDYVVVMRGPRYPGRPLAPGVGRGERVLVDGEFELWRLGH
jgi:hypothetical protein